MEGTRSVKPIRTLDRRLEQETRKATKEPAQSQGQAQGSARSRDHSWRIHWNEILPEFDQLKALAESWLLQR
jgi:hypothetical protein